MRSGETKRAGVLRCAIYTRKSTEDGLEQEFNSLDAQREACAAYKLAALACLAPDIVTAIVEGRQPATLSARTLQGIDLPFAWPDQRALLGFN